MSDGRIVSGIARDLSDRGLGAIVFADMQPGDHVLIKYEHPHGGERLQHVARRAVVRARFGSRYGFEFEHSL